MNISDDSRFNYFQVTGDFIRNQPPVAVASASPISGTVPFTVTFTGSNSSDPENGPLTYHWDFGDNSSSTLAAPITSSILRLCSIPSSGHQSTIPAHSIRTVANKTYYALFEFTRVADVLEWISRPPAAGEAGLRPKLHSLYRPVADFLLAAMQITQVFSVRLAILTLAMPVFLLFSLVALVDGLVQRDLRRWGGGRESSFVYHYAKKAAVPLLVMTWVIYLALPFSLHPTFVVLPFATVFALTIAVTASTFKKYL